MAGIDIVDLKEPEAEKVLATEEGHFADLKAVEISPAKLTNTMSAFANAEGGELYVGIDELFDKATRRWRGFDKVEDANGHLQTFENLFPLGDGYYYTFLRSGLHPGVILKIEIGKAKEIKFASNGRAYLRRGAQNLPVTTDEELARLKRNKGIVSFESETVPVATTLISNSEPIIKFMLEVVPSSEPDTWLRKQQVILGEKPTVAGLVLFAEEPQASLPKRCGLKIYRYKTSALEGSREALDFDPISIEGCAYDQIGEAVQSTADIIESVRVSTPDGLEEVKYPQTALHEVITNAVLHRDYSLADDIHIRIFDNRVEVVSPGTLPAHITPENILNERFARNGSIVRLINKFPNPPNKDVGEGLNTAFQAMRDMKLKPPIVDQEGGYVKVILRHEPLATPQELILQFLETHAQITNREARDITFIGSENKMKTILQKMVAQNLIELVPGTTRYNAAYRLPEDSTGRGDKSGAGLFDLG